MILQHASNLLHGFEAATQSAVATGIQLPHMYFQKLQGCFLQLPGLGRVQFAGDQLVELLASISVHPASLAQKRPAHVLQLLGFVFALGFHISSLTLSSRVAFLVPAPGAGHNCV